MNDAWPDFNDWWDYDDPSGTEARFRQRLASADRSVSPNYILQLKTQVARTLGLQRKFDDAHALLDQVEQALDIGGGGNIVEVRYLLERGRVLNSAKQPAAALPLFHRAFEIGREIGADFYTVDALHMLGIAAPPDERLDWNLEAIRYAESSAQERAGGWLASLYNNTGWTLFDEDHFEEALDLFRKALMLRQERGDEKAVSIARWCVAKTMRVLGRVEEALAIQRELEDPEEPDGFIEEEIAECLFALGKPAEAQPYFNTAYEVLSSIQWVAEDTARLSRLKELG